MLFNGSALMVNGTVYTSTLRFNGSNSGTIRGSIMADRQYVLQDNGSVDLTFLVDSHSPAPPGLVFNQDKTLVIQAGSYQEL